MYTSLIVIMNCEPTYCTHCFVALFLYSFAVGTHPKANQAARIEGASQLLQVLRPAKPRWGS